MAKANLFARSTGGKYASLWEAGAIPTRSVGMGYQGAKEASMLLLKDISADFSFRLREVRQEHSKYGKHEKCGMCAPACSLTYTVRLRRGATAAPKLSAWPTNTCLKQHSRICKGAGMLRQLPGISEVQLPLWKTK